ncbi:MAG: YmaB protein [candidate division TM6 bacterium GW2011_GWE2_41_16]|nr:MAG: YmaB protein [candidate division TM6 bacterium GW2011_GWE2_41_16]
MAYKTEKILVVPAHKLFELGRWSGIVSDHRIAHIVKCVQTCGNFLDRAAMESDESYKQIIPYVVLTYGDNVFVMERADNASEKRLRSKVSIGVGGHVRADDFSKIEQFSADSIDWFKRELDEEIAGVEIKHVTFLGALNDDSNEVGRVHCGVIYRIELAHPHVSIRDEHKSGVLMPQAQTREKYDSMEEWSKLVMDVLK